MTDSFDKVVGKVQKENNGCWLWTGYKDREGYGRCWYKRRKYGVHRLFYEIFVGQIPEGMTVDHVCFITACCNPEHLRLLSALDNARRQRSALKVHCKNGHELAGRNLILRKSGSARDCRACGLAAARRYQQKKRAA